MELKKILSLLISQKGKIMKKNILKLLYILNLGSIGFVVICPVIIRIKKESFSEIRDMFVLTLFYIVPTFLIPFIVLNFISFHQSKFKKLYLFVGVFSTIWVLITYFFFWYNSLPIW